MFLLLHESFDAHTICQCLEKVVYAWSWYIGLNHFYLLAACLGEAGVSLYYEFFVFFGCLTFVWHTLDIIGCFGVR